MIVEGRSIGKDEVALLIAEISANHDRDLEQAMALVKIAADAGWDCLKLQTYSAESLTMKSDHPLMRVDPIWGSATLHELYEGAAMPIEFHQPLFDYARELGMVPFTSVYDPRDLDFLEGLDCPIYKIASFELTFHDLLAVTAQTEKPIVLSTGMASEDEIASALDVLTTNGAKDIIVLHCCSSYPAPFEEVNLRAMETLERRFGHPIGFSDHTIGAIGPLSAIAMGAVAIEKHYTNDPARKGPDHRFSATPEIMREIADGARIIHSAMGNGVKATRPAEEANKALGRRSAFALRDISAGTQLTTADYRFIRPGGGVPADKPHLLHKRCLKNAVAVGHPITTDDLEAT